jgi:hypothetical protein
VEEQRSVGSVLGDVSAEILELARKQRMNTEVRKNIFCVLMMCEVGAIILHLISNLKIGFCRITQMRLKSYCGLV